MVDVSAKPDTARAATARGHIAMSAEALRLALSSAGPKGAVEGVAEIAGVMAAKCTADLIPLCHPFSLSGVEVTVAPVPDGLPKACKCVPPRIWSPGVACRRSASDWMFARASLSADTTDTATGVRERLTSRRRAVTTMSPPPAASTLSGRSSSRFACTRALAKWIGLEIIFGNHDDLDRRNVGVHRDQLFGDCR